MGSLRQPIYALSLLSTVILLFAWGLVFSVNRDYLLRRWEKSRLAGETALLSKNYAEAEKFLGEAALYAFRLGSSDLHMGIILTDQGDVYRAQNKYPQAEASYQQSVAIFEGRLKHAGEAAERKLLAEDLVHTLTDLAEICVLEGKYAAAEALYNRALNSYQKWLSQSASPSQDLLTRNDMVRCLKGLADLMLMLGRKEEAARQYEQALQIAGTSAYPASELLAMKNNYLKLIAMTGLTSQAKSLLAETLWTRHVQDGLAALEMDNYAEAERLLKLALGEAAKIEPAGSRWALVFKHLAEAYFKQGKVLLAQEAYKQALANQQKVSGPLSAECEELLTVMSRFYQSTGNTPALQSVLAQQLSLRKHLYGDLDERAGETLVQLAGLYHSQGQDDLALREARQAFSVYKDYTRKRRRAALLIHELAQMLQDLKDYERAAAMYKKALAIYMTKNLRKGDARKTCLLFELASVYDGMNQPELAASAYNEATGNMDEADDTGKLLLASTLRAIADRYVKQAAPGKAERWYKLSLTNALKAAPATNGYESEVAATTSRFAQLLRQAGRVSEALKLEEETRATMAKKKMPSHR